MFVLLFVLFCNRAVKRKGGGAVNFIMEVENLEYPDAVRYDELTYDEAIGYASRKGWGYINPDWNLEGLRAKVKRSMRTMSFDELVKFESRK